MRAWKYHELRNALRGGSFRVAEGPLGEFERGSNAAPMREQIFVVGDTYFYVASDDFFPGFDPVTPLVARYPALANPSGIHLRIAYAEAFVPQILRVEMRR